jgi:hypothetical protein
MTPLQHFKLLLLSLLVTLNAVGQLQLGKATLSYAAAKPLLQTERLATALKSAEYLIGVGGVAFDNEASPAAGLNVNSIELKYNSKASDGERLTVIINGQQVKTKIYDWELVPIAKHANSQNYACFTLFGKLQDENTVLERGAEVLNYSPEFFNTLMGLRLFQLDILIAKPDISIYLPQKNNQYILGPGENMPDTSSNKRGLENFIDELSRQFEDYSSYLICDENRDIEFNVYNGSLLLNNTPFYHFWKPDEPEEAEYERVSDSINEQVATQINPKEWYKASITEINRNAKGLLNQLEEQQVGEGELIEALHSVLVELVLRQTAKPIFVRKLSNSLSNMPSLFRNINPTVWDAGVKTMQYGAFFRYCKAKFPEQWSMFMSQIKRVLVYPVVKTPTVLHSTEN